MALKGLDSEKHVVQGCCWKAPSQAVPLGHAHNSQHWKHVPGVTGVTPAYH